MDRLGGELAVLHGAHREILPRHAITAGEDAWQRCFAVGIDDDAPGGDARGDVEHRQIEPLPDCRQHAVRGQRHPLAGRLRRAGTAAHELHPRHGAAGGDEADGGKVMQDAYTLRPGEILLPVRRAHFGRATSIGDGDVIGTKSTRLHRGVDRGVATADDDDTPPRREVPRPRRLPQFGDETDGIAQAGERCCRRARHCIHTGEAEAKEHRVEITLQRAQRQIGAERAAMLDADAANGEEKSHLALSEVVDELVGRDAVLVEPTRLRSRLEHRDVVAMACQAMGTGETGRAGADNGDALAARLGALEGLDLAVHQPVGGVALEQADLHRPFLLGTAYAGLLTENLRRADAGATAAENILLEDAHGRTLQVAGGDAADEARNVDACRAGVQTGRVEAEIATIGFDQGLVVGERRMQVAEQAGGTGRARHLAGGTGGGDAGRLVHPGGLPSQRDRFSVEEIDCLVNFFQNWGGRIFSGEELGVMPGKQAVAAEETANAGRIRRGQLLHIVESAERAFAEAGFAGTTMTRLAEAAGLPKANLHYYFGTKEKLYRAVLENILTLWLDDMAPIVPERAPAEALGAYIRAKMGHSRARPHASKVFASEILHGAPHLRGFLTHELRRRVTEKTRVIEHWIARGRMAKVDPVHLFFAIWAMTQTYADFDVQMRAVLGCTALGAAEYEAGEETVLRLVLHGCGLETEDTNEGEQCPCRS